MGGWYGVDLDGTLARYTGLGDGSIGEPIPVMIERVQRWLADGREVRIVTARVGTFDGMDETIPAFIEQQRRLISEWCLKHIGAELQVTASKDFGLIELWDDLAVQVEMNTGRRVDGRET